MRARLLASLILALGLVAPGAIAQTYPAKPIRMVVPFPPGSTTDIVGRIYAQKIGPAIGEQIIVENRGGAGGTIGTEYVAKAAPDGYTLLMGTIGTHSINSALYKKIGYHPIRDFAPISQFGSAPNVLVVNPSLPANSVKELIAYAKTVPGQLNYGSSGNGTSNHLSGTLFSTLEGLQTVHVPYSGGAQAIEGLLRGDLKFMFYHYTALLPHIEVGKMRPLAVTSATRLTALPNVPTMGEAGIADVVVSAWFGVYAPAGTPPAVITKLNAATVDTVATPEMRQLLLQQGVEPITTTPEGLTKLMEAEMARWAKAVAVAGAKVD